MPDDARREDAQKLCGLLAEWTGEAPVMWGTSIVGFGRYATATTVAMRARRRSSASHLARRASSLYLVGSFQDRYPMLLEQLGPHKLGKGCLYLKRLDDVDHEALRALVERTVRVHRGADRRAGTGA